LEKLNSKLPCEKVQKLPAKTACKNSQVVESWKNAGAKTPNCRQFQTCPFFKRTKFKTPPCSTNFKEKLHAKNPL
jgi:hypothetical protein